MAWPDPTRLRRIAVYGGIAVGAAALSFLVIALAARLSGEPIGPFPGGAFRGTPQVGAFDPVALEEVETVELQVGERRPRTLTTLVAGSDGHVYVPSAAAARKVWPSVAMQEPEVVLRLAGQLRAGTAVRVTDEHELARVRTAFAEKYRGGRASPADDTWFFRIEPKSLEAQR